MNHRTVRSFDTLAGERKRCKQRSETHETVAEDVNGIQERIEGNEQERLGEILSTSP